MACFAPHELAFLVLSKDFPVILKIAENNLKNLNNAKILTNKLTQTSVNSKAYEYFIAIFDLYELFHDNCQFCFNLNSKFNQSSDRINTLDDLEKYRLDPPDIIVYHQKNLLDFEFKRYRGKLSTELLYDFINRKIINHYSDYKCNYYIILQPAPNTTLDLDIFENLHKKINKLNRKIGKIAFSLNNNNKEMLVVSIFPDLTISKRPFMQGSSILIKNL